MEKLRFMLIGCGRISKNHIAAAAANKDTMTLAVVCDPVRERAEVKAAMLKEQAGYEPLIYTDYKKHWQSRKLTPALLQRKVAFMPALHWTAWSTAKVC